MDTKQEDLEFINRFSKITIKRACDHFGFNQSNITHGKSTKESTKKVRKYLEKEVANLYIEESKKYVKDSSL